MAIDPDLMLYHAYLVDAADAIDTFGGLQPGSYLGSYKVAMYYAGQIEDEGFDADIVAVPLSAIAHLDLAPDQNGIDEPLGFTLGLREDDIQSAWQQSDGTWQASYGLIQSLRCMDLIPLDMLQFDFNIEDHNKTDDSPTP
jgi:hypothetical protein